MEGYQRGGRGGRTGEDGGNVQGIRSIIGRYKIGEVKNTIGNEEAKELCMTHGHKLRVGGCWRVINGRKKMKL